MRLFSASKQENSIAFCGLFNIKTDMGNSSGILPSTRSLSALERVAQLGNVTRAAEELNTSQAAISRHLRRLEADLGVALVTRSGRGIVLTPAGQAYAREVSEALTMLRQAGARAALNRHDLVIACTHEVSHLILMPHYGELKKALGSQAHIRVVTCEYESIPAMIDAGADLVFQYRRSRPSGPSAKIVDEEILPVAAPCLIERHGQALRRDPDAWKGVPRLCLSKANSGWATWEDWFSKAGLAVPEGPQYKFDNYVYALESATRGEGAVLAWRGFTDVYLQTGQLTPLCPDWVRSGAALYAVPSSGGLAKEVTRKCLKVLPKLTRQRQSRN
ncbi:LysR family transcriptional regulator [Leisingera sp. ANG59]|uniref:LysR family transcriptional regulator n=1 Tax=Leisingera sp. ANG59 TaxID=2675221 RepID=UPI0015736A07|nr:LysR family transcriptional regulator [Leisingera sp. ANG59]NSY40905.1 LysR family transcriptional regulator [Leisingera sp. ANG59]